MFSISQTITRAVACAAVSLAATSMALAADKTATQVVKPAHGVSLDVGTNKVAGVYIANNGVCDVTLMFGDQPDADGHVTAKVTRVNVPVKAGGKTRVYTDEGKAIEVACGTGTRLMMVRALEQTALSVAR